ncbi:MAG: site-specific integrase [Dehalobacter sp.]|nr:site-specific integrase [Dehalobacter sp.]
MAGNIVKVKEGYYRLRYKDSSQYVKAKSDREAEKIMAKFITDVDSGDYRQPSKMTFKQFAERWIKEYGEVKLAPKTLFIYKQMLQSRIYPEFGDKKLEKIKPLELLGFYSNIRKEHKYISISKDGIEKEKKSAGLTEKTIKHHHGLICAIYEKAIKWGVLKGDNPARRIDPPQAEKKKARCYDEAQTKKLLAALDTLDESNLRDKVVTMIAIMTGARLGEIMGLEWQDIHFDQKVIEIRQSSQYLPGKGVFIKKPKTEMSERKISVNDTLLTLLQKYQDDQREKGFICQDNNLLFVAWDGKPMHPNSITKWFPAFLRRNGLPPLNFHGLRHTSATFLISKGMDIQTVAGRLGHSTSATTQNIYSHFLESKDRQAADLMEDAFATKKETQKQSKSKSVYFLSKQRNKDRGKITAALDR